MTALIVFVAVMTFLFCLAYAIEEFNLIPRMERLNLRLEEYIEKERSWSND